MEYLGLNSEQLTVVLIILIGLTLVLMYAMYRQLQYYVNLRRKFLRIYSEEEDVLKGSDDTKVRKPYTIAGNLVKEWGSEFPITDHYDFQDHLLGRGSSAEVVIGIHKKQQHRRYAVKLVDMRRASAAWRYDREQSMLKDVNHVNIVKLFEVYRKDRTLYFVMELCSGGHLGHALLEAGGKFPESTVKRYITQLTQAIKHCHMRGIAHRDIKLQNVLIESNAPDAQIKLIDFGNAARFREKLPMKKIVGTTYTVAPEVFKQSYDERCDVWSLGVVTYILLSGHRPFDSQEVKSNKRDPRARESAVITNILLGRYHFLHDTWDGISEDAIFFVRSCLETDYQYRRSAERCLKLSWLSSGSKGDGTSSSLPDQVVSGTDLAALKNSKFAEKLLNRLRQYMLSAKLRRIAMMGVAFDMPPRKVPQLRNLFQQIDDEGMGYIGKERFKNALSSLNNEISAEESEDIFDAIDLNMSETIHFNEFVAAAIEPREVDIKALNSAFLMLDINSKGYINKEDILRMLVTSTDKSSTKRGRRRGSATSTHEEAERRAAIEEIAAEAIEEVDMDHDGVVSYTEYLYAIADGSSAKVPMGAAPLPKNSFVRAAAEQTIKIDSSIAAESASSGLLRSRASTTEVHSNHRRSTGVGSDGRQKAIISRRGTESSLSLSLSQFHVRRSSIVSKRGPKIEQEKNGKNISKYRKNSIILPSAFLSKGSSFSKESDINGDEDVQKGEGRRRNSMVQNSTPEVPTVLQLVAEDLSLASRSFYKRVTGLAHRPSGSVPLSHQSNTHAGDNSNDNDDLSDEEDWIDLGGEEEGVGMTKRENSIIPGFGNSRRMSSPAMIWNNLRRRSSVLKSVSNLVLPDSISQTNANFSDKGSPSHPRDEATERLDRVESGGSHSKRERRRSNSSNKQRKIQSDIPSDGSGKVETGTDVPFIRSGTNSPVNLPPSTLKGSPKTVDDDDHGDQYDYDSDDNGNYSNGEHVNATLKANEIINNIDDDEDGGVYVLDEGPVLLREVVAAASLNSLSIDGGVPGAPEVMSTPSSPITIRHDLSGEIENENSTSEDKAYDASVRGVIEALHTSSTVQRLDYRETDRKGLSKNVKGLLNINTDLMEIEDRLRENDRDDASPTNSKSSKNRDRGGRMKHSRSSSIAGEEGAAAFDFSEEDHGARDSVNDDTSLPQERNKASPNRTPVLSRDHTRDWDADASTLSDASEQLQTLVNYLKQKEAEYGNKSNSAPMTPALAQELSEKLAGPLTLLAEVAKSQRGGTMDSESYLGGSADVSMPTIHEVCHDIKDESSIATHTSKMLETFKQAFNAGLRVGRGESTKSNNSNNSNTDNESGMSPSASRKQMLGQVEAELELDLEAGQREVVKPQMLRGQSN